MCWPRRCFDSKGHPRNVLGILEDTHSLTTTDEKMVHLREYSKTSRRQKAEADQAPRTMNQAKKKKEALSSVTNPLKPKEAAQSTHSSQRCQHGPKK